MGEAILEDRVYFFSASPVITCKRKIIISLGHWEDNSLIFPEK